MTINEETGKGTITKVNTFELVLSALFAALIAVCSWISVPLPFTPVPINLATLAVTLTGILLGYKYGSLSVIVYLLLGAVGVPVFAGFTGGIGHIAGPTGGYIVGYLTSAFLAGLLFKFLTKEKLTWTGIALPAIVGTASCYILGTIWFMVSTNTGLVGALSLCVIPFLPGDVLKLIAAVLIVRVIEPKIERYRS